MSGERNVASQVPERKVDPERVKIVEDFGQFGMDLLQAHWSPQEIREVHGSRGYPTKEDLQYLINNAFWLLAFDGEDSLLKTLREYETPTNKKANEELAHAIIKYCKWKLLQLRLKRIK